MSPSIYQLLRSGRTWVYGIVLPVIIGLLISLSSGGISFSVFIIWILLCQLAIAVYEGFIRVRAVTLSQSYFAETNNLLQRLLPRSLHEYIHESGATGVTILGGTLGSFAVHRANVEALARLQTSGHPVRILMMDPDGTGIERLAEQRRQIGNYISAEELRAEIRKSVKHLCNLLGREGMYRSCRFYQHTPRNSIYRLGSFYFVTVYRFGAGGSSPTFALYRNDSTAGFCDGLDKGFEDVWSAESTRKFDDSDLE